MSVIQNACYNDVIQAENQNLPYTKIMVDRSSKFKYTAFGFENLANQNHQSLSCQVIVHQQLSIENYFCVQIRMCIQYADGSLDTSCESLMNRPCDENFSRKEVKCDNYDEFLMKGESCRVTVEPGKQFSTVKSLSKSFKFDFNFTPDSVSVGYRQNVLSLVSNDFVFLKMNMVTFNTLELCFKADNESFETCRIVVNELMTFERGEKVRISLEHSTPEQLQAAGISSAVFALKINGDYALTVVNKYPSSYTNVTIMMGNNDMPAVVGTIDDFHLFDLERNTMLLDSIDERTSEGDEMITDGVPTKGTLIESFIDWGVEYEISVEIKINDNLEHEMWGNVLHFGRGGANREMGDRIPAIFVAPRSHGKRIFVCASVTYASGIDEKSHCTGSGETRGEWTHVKIEQVHDNQNGIFVYRVFFNGALAEEIANVQARSYSRVHLWASNPWSMAANAEFRHLDYAQPRGRFLNEQQCQGSAVEWTPWLETKQFKKRRRRRRSEEEEEKADEVDDDEDEIMTWLRRKNKDLCHQPTAIQAQETVKAHISFIYFFKLDVKLPFDNNCVNNCL